jgi:uncharacterized protein with ATP-grasp and redox domains
MASEPGSFAQKTVRARLPTILEQTHRSEGLSANIRQELKEFHAELIFGRVKPLQEPTHDREIWNNEIRKWLGKKWDQLPWLIAEAFFYRRILEITRFFQPGPMMGKDPFEQQKTQEILDGRKVFADLYPSMVNQAHFEGFHDHVIKALWGNRGDLSLLGALDESMDNQNHHIILDHTIHAFEYLSHNQPGKIAYFFDNVGKELFFDLALIDFLFETNLAEQIICFAKPQPFFVSDVMEKDLFKSIDLITASEATKIQQLASRLTNRIKSGKLIIEAPKFLTLGLEFREMPVELYEQLQAYDLSILKGDLNYRRLMGDRHWPPTTPVAVAGGYFPTPFLSLRTLKAQLIVGLTDAILDKVKNEGDPNWLTNGKRGIITFCK